MSRYDLLQKIRNSAIYPTIDDEEARILFECAVIFFLRENGVLQPAQAYDGIEDDIDIAIENVLP